MQPLARLPSAKTNPGAGKGACTPSTPPLALQEVLVVIQLKLTPKRQGHKAGAFSCALHTQAPDTR